MENFNQFKKEYNTRDEKFTSLLNEKSILIIEQIQKFSNSLISDVEKTFEKANKPTTEVKDQKIDWLNKQVNELSGYKKKGLEYEKKITDLTNSLDSLSKKFELAKTELEVLKKNITLKDEDLTKAKSKIYNLEAKLSDYKSYMINNMDNDKIEIFFSSFKN